MSRHGALHVLVDGHNVLHLDPRLRGLIAASPERARAELERLLANRPRVVLFYDGGPGGVVSEARRQGLAIDYAGAGSADDRIMRWLLFHPDARATLVSDDAELTRRARAVGARILPARGFLDAVQGGPEAPAKPDRALSPAEVDEWMRIFGVEE